MMRFKLTYNGVVSEFNATENGRGGTVVGGKYTSHFIKWSVRPSKTNTIGVYSLIKSFNEDGTISWHFYAHKSVPRGLEVIVEEIKK